MSDEQTGSETPHTPQPADSGAAPSPAPESAPTTPPKAPETGRKRLPTGFATLRDLLSFLAGMGIIANEVFVSESVEPTAIAVGLTLTGLPLVFGADERKNRGSPP